VTHTEKQLELNAEIQILVYICARDRQDYYVHVHQSISGALIQLQCIVHVQTIQTIPELLYYVHNKHGLEIWCVQTATMGPLPGRPRGVR
jgi:hypothetical protein